MIAVLFAGFSAAGHGSTLLVLALCLVAWMVPGIASLLIYARWMGSPFTKRRFLTVAGGVGGPGVLIAVLMVLGAYGWALCCGYVKPQPQPVDWYRHHRRRR